MTAPVIASRAWLIATLNEAGTRLDMAEKAGSAEPDLSWVTDGVQINVKGSGGAFTLTATPESGQDRIGPLRFPRGWAAS